MWQEIARRDRKYRSVKLSPGFLFICVILNMKAVNCFIYKEADSVKLRDKVEFELDQIFLLFAVLSVKGTMGCLSINFMKLFCSVFLKSFKPKET